MMFTKMLSQMKNRSVPLTPGSKKIMPQFHKASVTMKTWGLSGLAFGVTGFVLLCYVTEWRTVLQYVPYYNTKYRELEISDARDAAKAEADNLERKINASKDFKKEKENNATAHTDKK